MSISERRVGDEGIGEAEEVGTGEAEEADDDEVIKGWNDGFPEDGPLLSEQTDGSGSGDDIVNGDHVSGGGADGLEGDDEGTGDTDTVGDALLKEAEHEITDGIAAGDKGTDGTDGGREEGPNGTDMRGDPVGHCDGHAVESRRIDTGIDIDALAQKAVEAVARS